MKEKLQCWKKARGDIYVKGDTSLEIAQVNFSWEKPAHNVIIRDKSKHSYESALGKSILVKYLGKKPQAIKFANQYMKKHDKC